MKKKLTQRNGLHMFKALTKNAEWPQAEHIPTLVLPVSVLAGDSDGLTPASGGQALAGQLPNAEFQVLEACGHPLMLEKPEAVLKAFNTLRARVL